MTSGISDKVLQKEIGKYFDLKLESVGPQIICLRESARKALLDNGVSAWTFRSSQNSQSTAKIVEECIAKGSEMSDRNPRLLNQVACLS